MTEPITAPPGTEPEILTECTELLRDRLPDDWRVDIQRPPMDAAPQMPDLQLVTREEIPHPGGVHLGAVM